MERLAHADLGEAVEVEEDVTPLAAAEEEEVEEPKTPEAKKPALPEVEEPHDLTAAEEIAALHRAATAAVEKLDDERKAQEAAAKVKKDAEAGEGGYAL